MDHEQTDPLARLRGETRKANQALRDYCHLGPGRSLSALRKLYQDYTDQIPPTRSMATLKVWSGRYHWQDRMKAWEAQEHLKDAQAWDERRKQFREKAYELSWEALQKFADMLKWPLAETEVIEVDDEGRPTVVKIYPGPWNYTSAAKMLAEANRVGLLALGEVTEAQEHRLTGSVNVLAGMADDELNDTIDRLMDRMATSGSGTPGPAPDGEGTTGENKGD